MSPQTIYAMADVARLLNVTRAAVTNYKTRYSDTPAPDFVTVDGREFWTVDGMKKWRDWQRARSSVTPGKASASELARQRAIEKLRAELS